MTDLPLVPLRGRPREQGRAHGEALGEAVCHNVAVYERRLRNDARLSAEQVRSRSLAYLEVFRSCEPAYAEAMEGVAEGSGCTIEQIAMLNARYELMYSAYAAIGMEEAAGECTAFAASRSVTADGHLWVGQNWDWIPEVRGALLDVVHGSLRILAFTEAGIVGGKIGMNSRGLGLVINGLLSHHDDWSRPGVPFHLRTARILRAGGFAEAVRAATAGPSACSANFLIAQASDPEAVADLEVAPIGWRRLALRDGTLVHANHFLAAESLGVWQPLREERQSTYRRCARMDALLGARTRPGRLSVEAMEDLLRDHDGHPDSICRHPNPALPPDERSQTVFSVLMDLDARRMRCAGGPPCTAAFSERKLG
ncbi:MAG: C45 family peptidase [Armatimonadota bacterium]|nr:C45 family peptidase [Armatimonadota bacterium]